MPKKRIVLMYISEISGHHNATLAVERAIREISAGGVEVFNINAFHYTNPISEKIVNRIYMGIIQNTPQIWDYLYDNPEIVKTVQHLKKTVHKINSPKLLSFFERFRPDVVACTQAFPCGMVADYKKEKDSNVPLVAVLTDYAPHAYWVHEEVNYYITPSEEVSSRLVEKGVPPSRVKALGIPFDHRFNRPVDKKKVMQVLNLDPARPVILIMGGGQGLGPIKDIVSSLEDSRFKPQEIVVTGSNKRLYGQLFRRLARYKNTVRVLGYADNVNELMSVSDLIITKPGGITTAEALAKRLPMIIVKPIPGQEVRNTAYLIANKAAIRTDDPDEMNILIDELLFNSARLSSLREAAGRMSKPCASMDIARLLLDLAHV